MIFNFNLHYSDCHKNRNRKLSINHKLAFSNTLSVGRCMYIYLILHIHLYKYNSKIVLQFSFVLFPPLPCLLFPICSSSDKYCFVFSFIFIYIQMELKHSACLRLWLTMKRAHCSNRPSLCPPLSCCLPCAIYFHLCVSIYENSTYFGLEQTSSFHIISPFRCR